MAKVAVPRLRLRLVHFLPHEAHPRPAGLGPRKFGDVALPLAQLLGHGEVVPLLKDRPELGDLAERAVADPAAGHLAGDPLPSALAVHEIELRITVLRHPDHARRD